MLEEAVYNIEQTFTPWNIQLELETSVELDIERLERAVETAANTHPLARARKRPAATFDTEYVWEIPDETDTRPVGEKPQGVDIHHARTEFHTRPIELTEESPFRVLVVRGAGREGGDLLCLSVSHVPADGVGTLRLLRSISRAYLGETPAADPVSLDDSRAVFDQIRPSLFRKRAKLLGAASSHLRKLIDPPSRLASATDTDRSGWGFVHRTLDEDLTERLIQDRAEGVSVNDILLSAVHLAVDHWNRDHGSPAGKISLLMPVNLRPDEWFYDVVGMYALFESIVTRAEHRVDPAATVEQVTEQTRAIKEADRAAAFLESMDLVPDITPVGVKRRSPELLRGPGHGLVDTLLLSNLGRVPEPFPSLGDGTPALWFSPPCWQPTPVSIGVVTVGGRVHLVFRHMFRVLDRDAAASFADLFLEQLTAVLAADV